MIGEIIRSQAPNKVLWDITPPVDPAEQLLPPVLQNCPLPAPLRLLLKAPGLQSLCRQGRRPHMPSRRLNGGPPLKLSHTSNRSGPPPGSAISGDPPAVFQSVPFADRLLFLSFLSLTPALGPLFFS